MTRRAPHWLLLVTHLPRADAALRMRLWRRLKAAGCLLLRDGVYALPDTPRCREILGQARLSLPRAAGDAYLFAHAMDPDSHDRLLAAFDRREAYGQLRRDAGKLRLALPRQPVARTRRVLSRLQRELAAVTATDFLPAGGDSGLEELLQQLALELEDRAGAREPRAQQQELLRRRRNSYRGRTWATRRNVWVDRVASAWLIRRFIDPAARFLWLADPRTCPGEAVGFDFQGAEFSHAGDLVTFQVLVWSFGLEKDRGLSGLGEVIRFLDVGGVPAPEAAGLLAIIEGAQSASRGDDDLLQRVTPALDALHAGLGARNPPRRVTRSRSR